MQSTLQGRRGIVICMMQTVLQLPVLLVAISIFSCISFSTGNNATLHEDKASYSKLQHDLQKMREKAAKLSKNTNSPEYATIETQLLRLEGRINVLRGAIWLKERGHLHGPNSLHFALKMLCYKLNTDVLLTIQQRNLLHDKLTKITIRIQRKRHLLQNHIEQLKEQYVNLAISSSAGSKQELVDITNRLMSTKQQLEEITD